MLVKQIKKKCKIEKISLLKTKRRKNRTKFDKNKRGKEGEIIKYQNYDSLSR